MRRTIRVTNPTRGIRASCASVAVCVATSNCGYPVTIVFHPFPAYEACNPTSPACDVDPPPDLLAKNLDVGPLHSKLRASRNHASSFLYSNAGVLQSEQRSGHLNEKADSCLLFTRLLGLSRPPRAASARENATSRPSKSSGKPVLIRPAVRASRILDEIRAAKDERSPSAKRAGNAGEGGAVAGGDQPSERMPRTTKPTFAGRSPSLRMK
jgi:hypothetical protein